MKSRITQEMRIVIDRQGSKRFRRWCRRMFRVNPNLMIYSIGEVDFAGGKLISSFKEAITIMNPDQ